MTGKDDPFDQNLKRMFESASKRPSPAYQEQLVSAVLAEVGRQRRRKPARPGWQCWPCLQPGWRPVLFAAGTATLLLMLAGFWWSASTAHRSMGQVSCLYGRVAVQNNGASQNLEAPVDLRSGQRVQTQTGSKARILLRDHSQLLTDPRTRLQIAQTPQGPNILLEQGTFSLEAAKQSAGKAITIQAPGARVKVLGTRLEVRLVEKPTGRRQTRVRVLSGQVELASAGQKLLLPAGTEGAADEGQPPVRSSLVAEVNDLLTLYKETNLRSAESGQQHGLPAIVDLTTATIWTVVPAEHLKAVEPGVSGLQLRYPAFLAKVYTLEGGEIPSQGRGQLLRLDLAAAGHPRHLLLKLPRVGGLLQSAGDEHYECALPTSESTPISLIQFRLPASARVEALPGAVAATATQDNKLIQTVAARLRLPQLYE